MNGKQFAIASLFAVVLLTLAFIPISSHQEGTYNTPLATQQTGTTSLPYDPWADINDDGIIDIDDIVYGALRYGTTGTPINKTALLLDLLDRVKTLEATDDRGVIVTYMTGMRDYRITSSNWQTDPYRQLNFAKKLNSSLLKITYSDTLGLSPAGYTTGEWRVRLDGVEIMNIRGGINPGATGWYIWHATHTTVVLSIVAGNHTLDVQARILASPGECMAGWMASGNLLMVEEIIY